MSFNEYIFLSKIPIHDKKNMESKKHGFSLSTFHSLFQAYNINNVLLLTLLNIIIPARDSKRFSRQIKILQ